MKKKGFLLLGSAALLSLALAGTIGAFATASADTNLTTSETSGTTTVKYVVEDTWTVTIPTEITINKGDHDAAGEGTITATNVVIEQGKELNVTVRSENSFAVKNSDKSQGFDYELKSTGSDTPDEALSDGDTVLTVEAAAGSGNATVSATITTPNYDKYSTGKDGYTDTLTFEVRSEPAD